MEQVGGKSLLPKFPMGAVRTTEASMTLGGHSAWCIMRNVNGFEASGGASDAGVVAVDVKGFSQLYQHAIGGDLRFF